MEENSEKGWVQNDLPSSIIKAEMLKSEDENRDWDRIAAEAIYL